MREAVILSAVRVPTGKFMGALKGFSAPQLGALVVREAVSRAAAGAARPPSVNPSRRGARAPAIARSRASRSGCIRCRTRRQRASGTRTRSVCCSIASTSVRRPSSAPTACDHAARIRARRASGREPNRRAAASP